MEPIIISQADYEAGNYKKGVPIMVGMNMVAQGKGGMNVGKEPLKITVKIKKAE
jgi:hypothetical protein